MAKNISLTYLAPIYSPHGQYTSAYLNHTKLNVDGRFPSK